MYCSRAVRSTAGPGRVADIVGAHQLEAMHLAALTGQEHGDVADALEVANDADRASGNDSVHKPPATLIELTSAGLSVRPPAESASAPTSLLGRAAAAVGQRVRPGRVREAVDAARTR